MTPLGLLFPASIKNNTEQIFVTCKELNSVKKSILNGKVCSLIAVTDLNKINSWSEIKGQSILINTTFKDQKEISNNNHLCFPFEPKSLNDLLSFSIYLQDDNNKEIEFKYFKHQFIEREKEYFKENQPKKYKKVVYQEKVDSEPEVGENDYVSEEIVEEVEEPKPKKDNKKEKTIYLNTK